MNQPLVKLVALQQGRERDTQRDRQRDIIKKFKQAFISDGNFCILIVFVIK